MTAQGPHRKKCTGSVRWDRTSWVVYKPHRRGAVQETLGHFSTRRAAEAFLQKWLESKWDAEAGDDPEGLLKDLLEGPAKTT